MSVFPDNQHEAGRSVPSLQSYEVAFVGIEDWRRGADEITQTLASQEVQRGTFLNQLACMAHRCSGKCWAPRPPNTLTLVETGSRSSMRGRGSFDDMATEELRMVSRSAQLTCVDPAVLAADLRSPLNVVVHLVGVNGVRGSDTYRVHKNGEIAN